MSLAPPSAEIPLFPLGTVLFPGGLLPLRVFEVRYLDMVRRAHAAGAPFGVVCLTEGAEVRVAGAVPERFATVGTLARIRRLDAPQPALLQIECLGEERFRIVASTRLKNGLWTARTEAIAPDQRLAPPDELAHTVAALRRLVDTLEARAAAEGDAPPRLPIAPPWRYDDCGWVANRWCELLPLQPELRQRLMELQSPVMRLELVSDLLARHGIA